jgi:hypothetical protein
MLNPQRPRVAECTGENIFVVRNGKLITPPLSAGALEGITQNGHDHRRATWASTCAGRRPRPQRPVHRRGDVRVRHRRRGVGGELGRRPADPVPRPDDHGDRRGVRKAVRGQTDRYKDWVEHVGGWTASRGRRWADAPEASWLPRDRAPEAVEIFDTTLRDGAQLEGISLTVDDKLRIAEQLDYLGVHFIEGGWPGRQPQGHRVLRARRARAAPRASTLVAFGSTRRPRGKVDDDPTLRNLARRRHLGGVHRGQELGLPRDRGACAPRSTRARRWWPTRCLPRTNGGAAGCFFDAEHFFDGYKRTPSSRCGCSRPRPSKGAETSCCATPTAGRCPTRWRPSSARSPRHFGDVKIGIHCSTTTPAARWPTRWPPCGRRRARAGHHQRVRRAHRQLQPHHRHPQPHAEAGHRRRCPRGG